MLNNIGKREAKKNMIVKTSESVFRGHPDKICDQVADGILDAFLKDDKESRVAIECMIKDNLFIIVGEVSSKAEIDYEAVAKEILDEIGLNSEEFNFLIKVSEQSSDISLGVDKEGAGDQGIMYGYATKETKELLPLPYVLSRNIAKRMDQVNRLNPTIFGIDGKCQVSVCYDENNKPTFISTIVVSAQTKPSIARDVYEPYILDVIEMVIPSHLTDITTTILINPTGEFVKGGSFADSGLTGRKLQVDSYGTIARHGGGAFSGKDYTKVDRSAAYYARYVARSLVEADICDEVEVSVAYAIGVPFPVAVDIKAVNSTFTNDELRTLINNEFDFSPKNIIKELKLKEVNYSPLACYGHFGNVDTHAPWEKSKPLYGQSKI